MSSRGRCYKCTNSSAMSQIHYILIDHKTGKLTDITTNTTCRILSALSCLSREKQWPLELYDYNRERQTIVIGISNTVFPEQSHIRFSFKSISRDYSLIILEIVSNSEDGTPSAATPPLSPVPPTLCASGIYKDTGPDTYKKHTQSLYISKRGPGGAQSFLPLQGAK